MRMPVARDISTSFPVDGCMCPLTQSHTVGWLTFNIFANAACDSPFLPKYSFSACMASMIAQNYQGAIAECYASPWQAFRMSVKDDTGTFWSRLQECVGELGVKVTQRDIAKLLKIAQPSVAAWNRPNGYPTIDNGIRIAKQYGLDLTYLYTGAGKRFQMPKDPDSDRLRAIWLNLKDPGRSKLLAYAEGLYESQAPIPPREAVSDPFRRRPVRGA